MKVLRLKLNRKYLRFYRVVYGIKQPYNVLLDGNFIFAALKFKVDIIARLDALLQCNQYNLFITKASLCELLEIGAKGAVSLAFARKHCREIDHVDSIMHFYWSLKRTQNDSKVNRVDDLPQHYFLATQDKALRSSVAKLSGIPALYMNKVSMVLEPPSDASKNHQLMTEVDKSTLDESERNLVAKVNARAIPGEVSDTNTVLPKGVRIKRKALAPNPLSNRAASASSKSFKKKKENTRKRHRTG